MDRLDENIKYQNMAICQCCREYFIYHVIDIRGSGDGKYVICPNCHHPVPISRNKSPN